MTTSTEIASWPPSIDSPRPAGPGSRARSEDRSPAAESAPWRAATCVIDADDLGVTLSERVEGVGPGGASHESMFVHDRRDGVPALRSVRAATTTPDGSRGSFDVDVVDRRPGPIPGSEFDPDQFLDGPRVVEPPPAPSEDAPPPPRRRARPPIAAGGARLIGGAAPSIAARRRGVDPATTARPVGFRSAVHS